MDLHALRQHFKRGRDEVYDRLRAPKLTPRGVKSGLRQLARCADEALIALWQDSGLGDAHALVAVGGFGRGELFPCSDVDVLLLLAPGTDLEQDLGVKAAVETFVTRCWDVGLEIGSSVRTLDECLSESANDVTVQTSLLESRQVSGSVALYQDFLTRYEQAMDPRAFFVAKTLEMVQRHTRYENTPYALEPNTKESPGGLRDLQVILWVAKAAGLGQSWDALARAGVATVREARALKRNEAWLSLLRTRLHLVAKRREDRLVFDVQTSIAESMGYTASARERASEAMMRHYYWTAKAVSQLNQILLLNVEECLNPSDHRLRPINERFNEKAGTLDVASDDLYLRQPHAILETFWLYQTTLGIKALSARTLRALYNARSVMGAGFRHDPVNHRTFMAIMQAPEGITHAMRLMNQNSVLGRYLWVFRRIVGQMQHDLFHVYTVDQHILMVLRNVRRFFIADHAHEYPFCSQLAAGWDKPWILYVAALFHDIAKGRGGDHSVLGVRDVRRFCREHDIDPEDADLIEFLVREHLSMSRVAQKEDLSDPEVVTAFARRVGNERYLTALYLLTVADIRGTGPKVWNAWKGKLLEDLYRIALRTLGGRAPDRDAEVEARKREVLRELALYTMPYEAQKRLWDTLDVSYFMRHDASDIAWHARQISRHVAEGKVIVRARISTVGEGLQVLVYTPDQPDLFARICGFFDQAGFSVQDAKVHTAKNGYALDTFQIVATAMHEHYRELINMVESGLAEAVSAQGPLPQPSRGRVSRRVRSFPIAPRVSLHPDEKAQRWLLNISASDRVGLLYSVARVLARHHVNLQLAKISTLGERVDDTFLIDGQALQQNRVQIELETELLDALKT